MCNFTNLFFVFFFISFPLREFLNDEVIFVGACTKKKKKTFPVPFIFGEYDMVMKLLLQCGFFFISVPAIWIFHLAILQLYFDYLCSSFLNTGAL